MKFYQMYKINCLLLFFTLFFTGCNLRHNDNVYGPVNVRITLERTGTSDTVATLIFELYGQGGVTTGTGEVNSAYFNKVDDNTILINLPGRKEFATIPFKQYEELKGGLFIFVDNAQIESVNENRASFIIDKLKVITNQAESKPGVLVILKGQNEYKLRFLKKENKVINQSRIYEYSIGTE